MELDLAPHPNQEHPEIIENDYGMTDGVIHLKLRAAVAGYVLRQGSSIARPVIACKATNIDCG